MSTTCSGLGLDCRYCHTSVEKSSFAGIPPTETCMTCHSQIWSTARCSSRCGRAWPSNKPIRWNRVHDLPDYVYFNHAIHVQKGVGCVSCHGRVDQMPMTWKAEPMTMEWCLECHRHPEQHLRPRGRFSIWNGCSDPGSSSRTAANLIKGHADSKSVAFADCSTCHR